MIPQYYDTSKGNHGTTKHQKSIALPYSNLFLRTQSPLATVWHKQSRCLNPIEDWLTITLGTFVNRVVIAGETEASVSPG